MLALSTITTTRRVIQDARGAEPHRAAQAMSGVGHHQRQHRQSRAVDCDAVASRRPMPIVVPDGNNPEKNAAMRGFGAEVVGSTDTTMTKTRVNVRVAEPLAKAGAMCTRPMSRWLDRRRRTYARRSLEERRMSTTSCRLEAAAAAAGCSSRDRRRSTDAVHRSAGAGADAFARSWRSPERVTASRRTFAEGIATRVTFDLTFAILKQQLDDFVTLERAELEEGVSGAAAHAQSGRGRGRASIAPPEYGHVGRSAGRLRHAGGNIDSDAGESSPLDGRLSCEQTARHHRRGQSTCRCCVFCRLG